MLRHRLRYVLYLDNWPNLGEQVLVASLAENRFLAELAYNRGDLVLRSRPEVLGIESTNFCNIKCIMCPRGEPDLMQRPLGHMNVALLERIIDQAAYFSEPCWLHWFGEPLMNPFLFEQIEIAKRKVPNLGISTNATLLREQNQIRLLESPLDTIIIAIDGATKDVYEAVRKSDRFTFEEVCANAEQFLARRKAMGRTKPHVILSIIAMDVTAPDLNDFRKHWVACGADQVIFKTFVNWGGQYSEVFGDLAVAKQRATFKSPRAHPCKLMWESMLVTWDGRVVPCCFDYDAKMVLGDLKTQTLEEVWNGPAYVALRKAELEGRNDSELCANCSQAPGHARDANWAQNAQGIRANMRPEFGWAVASAFDPASLEVGTSQLPVAEIVGMHGLETLNDRPLRWTDGAARVSVPISGPCPPTSMAVKLWNVTAAPSPIVINVNGATVFDGQLPAEGLQTTLRLPEIRSEGEAVIEIQSNNFVPDGDGRKLGVAIESLLLQR